MRLTAEEYERGVSPPVLTKLEWATLYGAVASYELIDTREDARAVLRSEIKKYDLLRNS